MAPPHRWPSFALAGLVGALLTAAPTPAADVLPLVPWPRSVAVADGAASLTDASRIVAGDARLRPLARLLADEVRLATGLRLTVAEGAASDGDVVLSLGDDLRGDSYRLTVADRVTVRGGTPYGVSLGTVTLLQLLALREGAASLPRLTVEDGPGLPYCGAMLDVARKPYSLDTLRQCVAVCRFYKIRYLHLHLTDENAWVFPSAAFPKLGSNNFAWAGGEKPTVYKRSELKELVAYADARGVTLVPEIELPGHSGQLRGTLPELFGYRDESGKAVALGVVNMVGDDALKALDTLIGEACDVFASSPYVHLGCDEADLGGVEKMPEVKEFMAKHKLSSPEAVFNSFVNRLHGIVKKHGKRMIVWEGAPLDPVAPPDDLIVMPWVGGSGAAAGLVKRGYAVINPPWGTPEAYFDPYLVNGAQLKRGEPLLHGATSLVWESPQEAAVPFLRHVGALRNEPTYNPDARRGHEDFLKRLRVTDARLDRLLYGFTFRAAGALDPLVLMRPESAFDRSLTLDLETAVKPDRLRYTLDGAEPTERSTAYTGPIKLNGTTTLKARLFGDDTPPFTFTRTYRHVPAVGHDAVGAKVTFSPERPGYPGPGPRGLTDGFLADGDEAGSSGWVGWARGERPVQVDVDLGRPIKISRLGGHFLRAAGGVALPESVELLASEDGKEFRQAAVVAAKDGAERLGWFMADVGPLAARFVRLRATAGGDWTFLDEVVVNPKLPAAPLKHAARGKSVTMTNAPAEAYAAPGVRGLTDGHVARSPDFLNLTWLGVEGKNFEATVDLGEATEVREVGVHFLQVVRAGVFVPRSLDVLVSDDGKEFRKSATVTNQQDDGPAYMKTLTAKPDGVRARFVRVVAPTNGLWLFADEVIVNPEPE